MMCVDQRCAAAHRARKGSSGSLGVRRPGHVRDPLQHGKSRLVTSCARARARVKSLHCLLRGGKNWAPDSRTCECPLRMVSNMPSRAFHIRIVLSAATGDQTKGRQVVCVPRDWAQSSSRRSRASYPYPPYLARRAARKKVVRCASQALASHLPDGENLTLDMWLSWPSHVYLSLYFGRICSRRVAHKPPAPHVCN